MRAITRRLAMKARPLLAIALFCLTAIPVFTKPLTEDERRTRLQTLRSINADRIDPTPLERAYLDVYAMLESDNQCGIFFGGNGARQVLSELVVRLKEQAISDTRIGVRMSGTFTNIREPESGLYYRLFEKAYLNSFGAFYRSKTFPSQPLVPHMGSFSPNTREARVLILLHELAHLIKGPQGTWLIPDDGANAQVSRLNTLTIETKCRQQIRAL